MRTVDGLKFFYRFHTDTFLNAFTRFTSRRGVLKEVISDRGTNFIDAVDELKKLVSQLDRQKLESKTAELGVTWRFNPPGAPHFGGAHEVLVKAAKKATYVGSITSRCSGNEPALLSELSFSFSLLFSHN